MKTGIICALVVATFGLGSIVSAEGSDNGERKYSLGDIYTQLYDLRELDKPFGYNALSDAVVYLNELVIPDAVAQVVPLVAAGSVVAVIYTPEILKQIAEFGFNSLAGVAEAFKFVVVPVSTGVCAGVVYYGLNQWMYANTVSGMYTQALIDCKRILKHVGRDYAALEGVCDEKTAVTYAHQAFLGNSHPLIAAEKSMAAIINRLEFLRLCTCKIIYKIGSSEGFDNQKALAMELGAVITNFKEWLLSKYTLIVTSDEYSKACDRASIENQQQKNLQFYNDMSNKVLKAG